MSSNNDTRMPFPAVEFDRVLAQWSAARGEPKQVRTVSFRHAERVDLYLFQN